ncbi:MAG TPA: hypothetical protein VEJ89_17395 [Myxococcaceae bacterium]|nr:hypothetical protein [Myxococcaceae bacterium]
MRPVAPRLLALGLIGCAHAPPFSPATEYAQALEAGNLDRAYALTTSSFQSQVSLDQFRERFRDPAAREARVAAVRAGLSQLAAAAPELLGPPGADRPAEVVVLFGEAVRAGRFDRAWGLLSTPLRERYTPELLARDFRTEPTASARLARALVAVEGIPVPEAGGVRFPVAGGGSVVVRREPAGWKLEALE